MRGNYKSFKGIHLTDLERMHQFIMGRGFGARQLNLCVETIHSFNGIVYICLFWYSAPVKLYIIRILLRC